MSASAAETTKSGSPGIGGVRIALRVVGVCGLLAIIIVSMMGGGTPLAIGKMSPPTHGPSTDGGAVDLADWHDQFVFVNIWATWCGPCQMELPALAAAAKKHPNIRFVGLVADSPRADVDATIARFGLPYPNVLIDAETQRAWNATAFPSSYLLGQDGVILWSTQGALDEAGLEAALAQIHE